MVWGDFFVLFGGCRGLVLKMTIPNFVFLFLMACSPMNNPMKNVYL